jgi:hypothetical protein
MGVVVGRCAGLDVRRGGVVATVRVRGTGKSRRGRERQTRGFGTTIGRLGTLAGRLAGFGVTLVGMEATGVTPQEGVDGSSPSEGFDFLPA